MTRRVIALFFLLATWLAVAAPAGGVPRGPAYAGDFPDPSVLVSDGVYWAYSTGSAGLNLQVMNSYDLRNWSQPVDPLPNLPSWAAAGLTWAPTVMQVGGQFLMYYTVHRANDRQCISVAVAGSPGGPFNDDSAGPLVCQEDHSGSIDPSPFTWQGRNFLLWKSDDNAVGQQTHLWAQLLSRDGRHLLGQPVRLLDQTGDWQAPAIEGPSMIFNGRDFTLFYGAGDWASADAGIGWARCASPLGPCVDQSISSAWLSSKPGAQGPSGPATFTDLNGVTRLAYHAWTGAVGYPAGARSLFIAPLSFTMDGRPVLR